MLFATKVLTRSLILFTLILEAKHSTETSVITYNSHIKVYDILNITNFVEAIKWFHLFTEGGQSYGTDAQNI
jgi:hypothetical protein